MVWNFSLNWKFKRPKVKRKGNPVVRDSSKQLIGVYPSRKRDFTAYDCISEFKFHYRFVVWIHLNFNLSCIFIINTKFARKVQLFALIKRSAYKLSMYSRTATVNTTWIHQTRRRTTTLQCHVYIPVQCHI